MDGGDLGQYIEKHRKRSKQIDERKIWNFFIQACLGIQYLHSLRILHRDLKCSNLFLNKCGELKIGDLGVAKELKGKYTETIVGTPYYLAPELCEEKPYNDKCDIWSLGCILYELCTLNHPFEAKTMGGLYLKIIRGNYEPISDNYSKEISEIVESCLQKCSEDRPTVQEILENKKIQEMAEELGYLIPSEYSMLKEAKQKIDFMTTYHKIKKEINESVGSDLQISNFASEDKNSKNSVILFKVAKNINSNDNKSNGKAQERNTSSKSRIAQNFEVIHKKPSLIKPIKIDLFDDSSKIMRTKSEIDGENINEESITEKSELIKKNNSGINKDKRTHAKFHKISPKKKLNRNIQSQITYDFSGSALDSNLSQGIENKDPNQKGSINKIEVYCPPTRSQRKYTQDSENNMVASCALDLSTKESDNNSFKEKEANLENGYEVIYRVKTTERRPCNNDQDQSIPTNAKQTLDLPNQKIKDCDNEDISIGTDEDEITMTDSTKQIDLLEEAPEKFSNNELKNC